MLILALGAPALILAATGLQSSTHPSNLLRDPMAVAETFQQRGWPCCSNLLGAVSTIGVWMWVATAAVSAFTALVLWLRADRGGTFAFLVTATAFTLWLAADDGFMIHESYKLPRVLDLAYHAWIPIIFSVALLLQVRRVRHAGWLPVLLAALGALAASWLIDKYVKTSYFWEDAFKLHGIFLWAAYHVNLGLSALMDVPEARHDGAAPRSPVSSARPNASVP